MVVVLADSAVTVVVIRILVSLGAAHDIILGFTGTGIRSAGIVVISLVACGWLILHLSLISRDGHRLITIRFAPDYQLALTTERIIMSRHEVSTVVSTIVFRRNDVTLD